MEKDEKLLEERAKEFFIEQFGGDFNGFSPADVDNLYEKMPMIDYFIKNKYVRENGETVKTFCYVPTIDGRKWAGY
jgi:hypothetical protein